MDITVIKKDIWQVTKYWPTSAINLVYAAAISLLKAVDKERS
jgi:hypothetical protein